MAEVKISYDQSELRGITRAFKAMDEQAAIEAKETSFKLVEFLRGEIISSAAGRTKSGVVAQRTAEGSKTAKSSKIGELKIGFASQRFSGGGTTQELWGGIEFGSKKYKQFPLWNKQGYFIYPTLRANQKELVRQWEESFAKILKEYD